MARRELPALIAGHAAGRFRLAVTTTSLLEVLTGPLRAGDEALAERYRAIHESWNVVALTVDIAATAINADALVTHDRDFSRLRAVRVLM